MHSSGILRFDDNINDMNFFSKFKVTSKGPHSLGGRNSNNINMVNRGLHPSYIGRFDLWVCGNSDPGTSFVMSPFCEIDGLYFDLESEPDEFIYNYRKDIEEHLKQNGSIILPIECNTKEEYYGILNKANHITKTQIKIESIPKNTINAIVDEDDNDDEDDEPEVLEE